MSGCNCDISNVLSWDESTQTLTVKGNLQVNDINANGNINLMTDTKRFNFGGGYVEKGAVPYVYSSGAVEVGDITVDGNFTMPGNPFPNTNTMQLGDLQNGGFVFINQVGDYRKWSPTCHRLIAPDENAPYDDGYKIFKDC